MVNNNNKIIRQFITTDQLENITIMKSSSQRSLHSHQKENINFLNRMVSPDPSHRGRANSFKHNTQRKCFISDSQSHLCFTQDGRQATHFFKDDENEIFRYCEKCAIMLASKGFNVQKLPRIIQSNGVYLNPATKSSTKNISRQQHKVSSMMARLNIVNGLKEKVCIINEQLQEKYLDVQNLLIGSGDKYASLIEQVASYFKIIEQLIEYQKYLAYNRVLTERANKEKAVRQFKDQIAQARQQLQNIDRDLRENEDIIATVTNHQFDSIIHSYQQVINAIPEILTVEPFIEVYDQLTLPPIPEELEKLAGAIIFGQPNDESFEEQNQQIEQESHKLAISTLINENPNMKRQKSPIVYLERNNRLNSQQSFLQGNSDMISEHSFSTKSALQRKNLINNKNLIKNCPKQILLQNSFSIASSIVNHEVDSSQESDQNMINNSQQQDEMKINFEKFQQRNYRINLNNEESLGQYFIPEDTLVLNQTDERSQTLLLNQ